MSDISSFSFTRSPSQPQPSNSWYPLLSYCTRIVLAASFVLFCGYTLVQDSAVVVDGPYKYGYGGARDINFAALGVAQNETKFHWRDGNEINLLLAISITIFIRICIEIYVTNSFIIYYFI